MKKFLISLAAFLVAVPAGAQVYTNHLAQTQDNTQRATGIEDPIPTIPTDSGFIRSRPGSQRQGQTLQQNNPSAVNEAYIGILESALHSCREQLLVCQAGGTPADPGTKAPTPGVTVTPTIPQEPTVGTKQPTTPGTKAPTGFPEQPTPGTREPEQVSCNWTLPTSCRASSASATLFDQRTGTRTTVGGQDLEACIASLTTQKSRLQPTQCAAQRADIDDEIEGAYAELRRQAAADQAAAEAKARAEAEARAKADAERAAQEARQAAEEAARQAAEAERQRLTEELDTIGQLASNLRLTADGLRRDMEREKSRLNSLRILVAIRNVEREGVIPLDQPALVQMRELSSRIRTSLTRSEQLRAGQSEIFTRLNANLARASSVAEARAFFEAAKAELTAALESWKAECQQFQREYFDVSAEIIRLSKLAEAEAAARAAL